MPTWRRFQHGARGVPVYDGGALGDEQGQMSSEEIVAPLEKLSDLVTYGIRGRKGWRTSPEEDLSAGPLPASSPSWDGPCLPE